MSQQKPFTPDAAAKVEAMTAAAANIYSAIQSLEAAQKSAEHWAAWETLGYFKHQLEEFLSSDHGEAGFEPCLAKESDKVFPRRKNPIHQARKMATVYNRHGQAVAVTVPEN